MSTVYNLDGIMIPKYNTPQAYGCVADGIHDCSAAIAACIAANEGGTVYFPPGEYTISSPIQTYPYFDKAVNLLFDADAIITPLSTMDYLLDIGGLPQDVKVGRGKIYIKGGQFIARNNLVTISTVHINYRASDVDLGYMNIYSDSCDGLRVGDVGQSTSNDAYLHNLYIRHDSGANTDSGVVFYSFDNNMNDCRVYYYNVNVDMQFGGQFLSDVHTLAGPGDVSQTAFRLHNGNASLVSCYGDSEATFLKADGTAGEIYLSNCVYFSYKTNALTVFDFDHAVRLKISGFEVTFKSGNTHTGLLVPYTEYSKQISRSYFDVDGVYISGASYLRDGDAFKAMQNPIGQVEFSATSLSANTWYKVGTFSIDDSTWSNLRFVCNNRTTVAPLSVSCSSAGVISLNVGPGTVITDDTGTYQFGFTLVNSGFLSASDYPRIDMYIKSNSAVTLQNIEFISNKIVPLSTHTTLPTSTLSSASVIPTVLYTVTCTKKKYLFIGDSYAEGYSHDGSNLGWCRYAVEYLGLDTDKYKIVYTGGYGFANGGFSNLLDTVTETGFTDVVVCGGYNDNTSTEQNIINGITAFKNKALGKWSNVKIHVGFIGYNKAGNGEGAVVNWEEKRANLVGIVLPAYQKCVTVGCEYLNNVEYALGESGLTPSDGYHPSAVGNQSIAKAIANALLTGSASLPYNSDLRAS